MAKSRQFKNVQNEYLKRGKANPIFAVMCEGGGVPTVLHPTFDSAAAEAARLAHLNPGSRFHVLASKRVSFAEPAPAVELAA